MGVRIFALLALAVGSNGLEVDLGYLETVASDLQDHLSSNLRSFVNEVVGPKMVALPAVDGETTCKPCLQRGVKFLMNHTASKMASHCQAAANSDNRMAQKICGMMAKHPKVTMGMMIEHVRPMGLSMAYCFGAGKCSKPEEVTMSEIAMGQEPHEALLDSFDKEDWSDVEQEVQENFEEVKEDSKEDEEEPVPAEPAHKESRHMNVCPRCMRMAMRRVMGGGVKKVKAMCAMADKSNNAVMKKMCPWMKENKEAALGMLVAKMEPWKFALGFCMHKKMSSPLAKISHMAHHMMHKLFPGHHGHHHGHHGHHHGHGGHHGPEDGVVV